jgi:hypothetical protein
MKRIMKIVLFAAFAMLFLPGWTVAQEKKEQKKIKIVVADNAGTRVVFDTTFTGNMTPDSVTFKDGKVLYIKSGSDNFPEMSKTGQKQEKFFVTVSPDGKGDKTTRKEITVIAGDSLNIDKSADCKKIVIISDGKELAESSYTVKVSSGDEGKSNKKTVYYYVNNDKSSHKEGAEKFDVEVHSDEPEMDLEKSSYVIAKDGMVVTIEGGNEEKVKELAGIIEAQLGVNKDNKTKKPVVVKEETRKTGKE